MHGRVKVISTEEQKRKQALVREAKLKAYNEAMAIIFDKRLKHEYDDQALKITGEVLQGNPDIITLWNYRREIFTALKDTMPTEELLEKLKSELYLTESCLRVNPKSYGTWHYRIWVLDNLPKDEWKKEIKLCDKYLEYDERNFHAWHYRKVVIERANVPAEDEYNFTTKKIESNFSNYSAWHFRSKLLPKLFEDPEGKFPISEQVHKDELELVQNAAFTDPDDQSAWFYQRWLLGLRSSGVSITFAKVIDNNIVITTSRPILINKAFDVHIESSGVSVCQKGTNALNSDYSAIWSFDIANNGTEDTEFIISLISREENGKLIDTVKFRAGDLYKAPPTFSPDYSDSLKKVVVDQLQSCQELLELEPDSKWTLLTSVFLMRYLNLEKYYPDILNGIQHLIKVDPYRTGYYSDLHSLIQMEHVFTVSPYAQTCSLANNQLSRLHHSQYLILTEYVDLKNNRLSDGDLPALSALMHCSTLVLDGNLITSFKNLPRLGKLENLSGTENPLKDKIGDEKYLRTFKVLKTVAI